MHFTLELDIREETEYSPDTDSYGSLHRICLWPCLRDDFIGSCNQIAYGSNCLRKVIVADPILAHQTRTVRR